MYQIGEEEIEAIRGVFRKKKLFRYQSSDGECDLFEKEFSEKIGSAHSVLLSSGTNALIAALEACGVGPGDEVIIPSYTFVATAAAVVRAGATPVIADIDETLGISPTDLEARITAKTKAIIPVHMDGLAADMGRVMEIANRRKLLVIEDVAQAIGGSFQGRRLGTFGEFGCFSLNENKNISCGEGGIISTARRDLYEKAFCIQDASAQFNPYKKGLFTQVKPFLGNSMRVSEILGAIMRVQLGRLDGILSGLRLRKRLLLEQLDGVKSVQVVRGNCLEGDCGSSLHLLAPDPERAMVLGRRLRERGMLFAPVTARPAHASWKWTSLLPASENYSVAGNLRSVDILMRTVKMDIDLNASEAETRELGAKIAAELTAAPAGVR